MLPRVRETIEPTKQDQQPRRPGFTPDHNLPFVGREAEVHRLRQAIQHREGLVIAGPAGIGKTALVMKVWGDLPVDIARSILYVENPDGLRGFLYGLLNLLHRRQDPVLRRQLRHDGARPVAFKDWLRRQDTSRLRGTLYLCMESDRYSIFVDHVLNLTSAQVKVIREIIWARDTPVFLLTRPQSETSMGHLPSLCWGQQLQFSLGPLPKPHAGDLLDHCIQAFKLFSFDEEDFREEVLQLSGRVPGTIVKMCDLAQDAKYQCGLRIKTKLLYIDCTLNGSQLPSAKNCYVQSGG